MTDRYSALTIVLDNDLRSDDCEDLIKAIKMLKGVLRVEPFVTDVSGEYVGYTRARSELLDKILAIFRNNKVG